MLALYRSGRQVEALQAYQRTKSLLRQEFGIDPCQELQDLEAQILEHDHHLDLTNRSVATADGTPASACDLGRLQVGETCTAAFLFTDVEDSTVLWDTDQSSMELALAGHDEIVAAAVEAAGGRVFKHTGDGMLSMFPDVDSAVAAGAEAIAGFAVVEWGRIGALPVRMAIDFGDALVRTHDLAGPVLNRANRLLALANSGQLLLSEAALAALQDRHRRRIVDLGDRRVKGLAPMRVFELVLPDAPAARGSSEHLLSSRPAFPDHIRGYDLKEQVGEGPLAIVYRAIQQPAGREVAIKVVRPEVAGDPDFVRCFESDAKTVAQLNHPHVAPLYDYWREADRAYLVMQYVRGGTLRLALDRGAWHVEPALRLLEQVAGALEYAHRQGVVHRDLRPANILLDNSGNAILGDFGVATCAPAVAKYLSSVALEFLAPEVQGGGAHTPKSDLCSLGHTARELLTGHRPDLPVRPDEDQHHDLPSGFTAILARATAEDPDERFDTPGEFFNALWSLAERDDGALPTSGRHYGIPMLC
jgi:class 3 adenylate cyclase